MPIENGGGFALSVGSHKAEWRHRAHEVIGATTTMRQEGYQNVDDYFANRAGFGTCNLKQVDPKLNDMVERNKRIYDVKAGDIIFHTRWLFHRTIPFHNNAIRAETKRSKESQNPGNEAKLEMSPLYRRYSIRYTPGHAQLPKG